MAVDTLPRLEPNELAEIGPPEAVRLPLDLVDPNPQNPRAALTELDALAASIREFGLLQPVTVRRSGERYELLGGHRRRAAFVLLREAEPHDPQWRTIPAVVRTADEERGYLMLLSGQIHGQQWRPREEAAALERLVETRTLKEVGVLVHKGESWVSRRLRVYADSVLSAYVQTGRMPTTVAEEFLMVRDPDVRKELADQALEEGWGQTQARNAVRSLRLDKQLREVGRRARELLELLSMIDASRLPRKAMNDLWMLQERVAFMGKKGSKPVLPTIEAAQRAAGVNPDKPVRARRTRLKIE